MSNEFESKQVKLSNAKLTSPSSILIDGISYELLDKVTDKVLNRELGMVNKTFSNQLYQRSLKIWQEFNDTMYDSTQEFRESHKVSIIGDQVVAVSAISGFDDFYEGVGVLAKVFEGNAEIKYNDSYLLEAIIRTPNKLGIQVEYYLDSDYARVRSLIYQDENKEVYINPVSIVDSIVEVSFKELLNPQVLRQYLDTDNIINYSYREFVEKMDYVELSVSEIIGHLKTDLGIKYTPDISAYDIAAEDSRFDQNSVILLSQIFELLRPYNKIIQYASPLKKEVSFTLKAKLYYKLLSYMTYIQSIEFYKLADFIGQILSNQLNYNQINDGVK